MSKFDELVKYILNLTPEQAEKIVKRLDYIEDILNAVKEQAA